MHVIEHLAPAELDDLLALARTRLRPGGLFVAETINPHATHALKTFWVDPTHRHPIFPEVALVRAASAGFGSAFVMHPRGERVVDRDRFVQDAYALVAEA
jgi:cyclopropane fatty-acyl-phospholipid synthase-like methyltransferase